ncbi:hypothetical protein ACFWNG_05510 [Streptomyces sp. NPDC058391]|uniref:hypothetical protein n=1 Tax=Streptomyces sp. NPDC058391 TaxID=3346476 RepID=UPI00364D676C
MRTHTWAALGLDRVMLVRISNSTLAYGVTSAMTTNRPHPQLPGHVIIEGPDEKTVRAFAYALAACHNVTVPGEPRHGAYPGWKYHIWTVLPLSAMYRGTSRTSPPFHRATATFVRVKHVSSSSGPSGGGGIDETTGYVHGSHQPCLAERPVGSNLVAARAHYGRECARVMT